MLTRLYKPQRLLSDHGCLVCKHVHIYVTRIELIIECELYAHEDNYLLRVPYRHKECHVGSIVRNDKE